jgi:hypothetical protein
MDSAANAKLLVDITKRQMKQLDAKIKQLAECVEQEKGALGLTTSQAMLQKMQDLRTRLEGRLAAAQRQLSQAAVDEDSLEDVERHCPM